MDYRAVLSLSLACTLGFCLGVPLGISMMKSYAIRYRAAHYDATTGDFTWNGAVKAEKHAP